MATPRIIDVRIEPDKDEPGYSTVGPVWADVDRPYTGGWMVRNAYVPRFVRALKAGVVEINPTVRTDVNGNTFVSAQSTVSAKRMNADLRRLGY